MTTKFYEGMVTIEMCDYFEEGLKERKDSIQNVYKSSIIPHRSGEYDIRYYVIEANEGIINSKNEITKEKYELMRTILERLDV